MLTAASLVICACGNPSRDFGSLFAEPRTIQLREPADDPITGIRHVSRRPGGGFIVADEGAARVRLFDASGHPEEILGGRGDGPGEFRRPTAAVELPDGRIVVADGTDPTLTIFSVDRTVRLGRVPGQYGVWLEVLNGNIVAGVGSRGNRYALLDAAGDSVVTFGPVPEEVNEVPFWIFFARDHATIAGGHVVTNTSFYPTLRVFDGRGDSVRVMGSAPSSWTPPMAPPINRLSGPGDRERIAEWSRGFTVVVDVATVADSLIVVQYGIHDPQNGDPYAVRPGAIDVYTLRGEKLTEALALDGRIVGGGRELLVLSAQPPNPWTLTMYTWRGR